MEWQDEGTVLSMRPHGESAAIIEVFTRAHGRHAGLVRGGVSRRMAPHMQPGTQLALQWSARLAEHMGAFTVEPLRSRAHVLQDRLALAGLSSTCALLALALPERQPHPILWLATMPLLDSLGAEDWPTTYLRWELRLLQELGFGLDLTSCAATGATTGLEFLSPKTGRAVSRAGAGEWIDRLLPLPPGLQGDGLLDPDALRAGFAITSHFLTRELAESLHGRPLPEARGRLLDLMSHGSQLR